MGVAVNAQYVLVDSGSIQAEIEKKTMVCLYALPILALLTVSCKLREFIGNNAVQKSPRWDGQY
jgi:hypothetical protein